MTSRPRFLPLLLLLAPATAQIAWGNRSNGISRNATAACYDPTTGRTIVFGGYAPFAGQGDTWLWDGATWYLALPGTTPESRSNHAMAFHEASGRAVLYGGFGNNSNLLGDTILLQQGDLAVNQQRLGTTISASLEWIPLP